MMDDPIVNLPFQNENDEEIVNDNEFFNTNLLNLQGRVFHQFNNDYDRYDAELDPDINHFNQLKKTIENCDYIFADDSNLSFAPNTFSVCHLNIIQICLIGEILGFTRLEPRTWVPYY